jgi:hypothetical protein
MIAFFRPAKAGHVFSANGAALTLKVRDRSDSAWRTRASAPGFVKLRKNPTSAESAIHIGHQFDPSKLVWARFQRWSLV